jgi:hypothetical protein
MMMRRMSGMVTLMRRGARLTMEGVEMGKTLQDVAEWGWKRGNNKGHFPPQPSMKWIKGDTIFTKFRFHSEFWTIKFTRNYGSQFWASLLLGYNLAPRI